MKMKKMDKKLVLNRETIVNLDSREMSAAHGGIGNYTARSCITELLACTAPQCCYDTFWCTDPVIGVCQTGSIPTVDILC
jgi:hypothetical protein